MRVFVLALMLLLTGCAAPHRLPDWMTGSGGAPPPVATWAMESGGPARTARSEYPFPGTMHRHRMIELVSGYRYAPDEYSSPIVLNGTAFIGHSGRTFEAVRLHDETRLWVVDTPGRIYSTAAYGEGLLVFGDDHANVFCVNLAGETVWTFSAQYPVVASPLIANGKVYVTVADQNVFCLDLTTGSPIWQYGRKLPQRQGIWRSTGTCYADGRVYAGFSDGTVVALDAALGRVLWRHQAGDRQLFGDVTAGPTVADGRVYAGALGGPVVCLDARTGDLLWQQDIEAANGFAVGGALLYLGSAGGEIVALRVEDGGMAWSTPLDGGVPAPPVLAGDRVVTGASRGSVFALDAETGAVAYRYLPGPGLHAQPLVFDGGLLFHSDGGVLHWMR